MIVDDEEAPRQALEILFQQDYRILLAENGHRAIELAGKNAVDAAIVDIWMPSMSGIEVLDRLKKLDATIEVIILTAYETIDTARQALRLGACDYLTKPFDMQTIRQAVGTAMERRARSEKVQSHYQKLLRLQEDIQSQSLREEMARTRSEIYASIIHDINGPLTAIYGWVEMIKENLDEASLIEGEALETMRDHLYRISLQINNCVSVSSRYLSFLRGHASQGDVVSVNQILHDLGKLLKTHSGAKTNQLTLPALPKLLAARINGTDLLQMLLNLTVNGLQCSPSPHRVEIKCCALAEALNLEFWTDGPSDRYVNRAGFKNSPPLIAVSVQDNGPGIAPETLGKLFEPYFTTKPAGQGTGLGLAIVKRLVEQAKGALHVHTAPGHGTEFTVYLPGVEGQA